MVSGESDVATSESETISPANTYVHDWIRLSNVSVFGGSNVLDLIPGDLAPIEIIDPFISRDGLKLLLEFRTTILFGQAELDLPKRSLTSASR